MLQPHLPPPTGGRRRATAALLAVLLTLTAGLVGTGPGAAVPAGAQAAADPIGIATGDLDWGVRQSFRSYVGADGITVFDGVTRGTGGTFHWPLASGTFDEASKATVLQFGGRVHFSAHDGALDLNVARPRLEITEDGGALFADMSGLTHSGQPFEAPGAEIATVAIEEAEPVVTDTTTTWSGLPARLAEAGVEPFAGFYSVGAILDDLHVTYEGPGGKPDLTERWSRPDTPVYEAVVDRSEWGLQQVTRLMPDEDAGVVHSASTIDSPNRVVAFDIETLEIVGQATLPWELRNSAAFYDAELDTLLVTPRSGDGIWAIGYDAEERAYETPVKVGASPVSEVATYDPISRTIYDLSGGWSPTLYAHRLTVDGDGVLSIARISLGTVPSIYPRGDTNMAVDPRGRLVIGTAAGGGSNGVVVDVAASPISVTQIPGTAGLETVELIPGDGVVFGYGGVFKRYLWDGTSYVFDSQADVGTAGTETAVDPATGAIFNLLGGSSGQISVIVGDDLTQQFDHFGFGTALRLTWADGALLAYHPTFEQVAPGQYAYGTRLLRYQQVGTTPAVTSGPAAVTVTAPSPTGTVPAGFSVEATGDPAPTIQWQSRAGGVGRFADIAGATDSTLEVAAGASITGTEYRAVVTNEVGAVATDPATLTVLAAPSVTQQPDDVVTVEGDDAVVKVMPAGNPYPEITWQRYAAGFWWNIGPDDDGFEIDGGFLTVTDTNLDQSGTRFRARLRNDVGTVHTRVVTLTVTEAADGPQHVVGGDLDWGVRQSFRTYITGPIAHGSVAVEDGASTDEDGTYSFPATGGTVADDAVEAAFGGAVHFTGHVGMGTPPGVPALDMRVSDIRVDVDGQDGTLVADVVSRGLSSGSLVTYDDVVFAALDLSTVSPTPVASGLRWANVPATLTEAGVPAFADFYPAGSVLDPLTVTLVLSDEEPEPEPGRSAVESFATAALVDFLGGEPTTEQVAAAVAAVETSGKTAFLRSLSTSDEWLAAVVDGLYADTLGRPAGANERAYWVGRLRAGWTVARVTASFYAAPEYHERVGGTDATWVADLYATLLGRTGGPHEIGWWVGEVRAKGRGNVALRFFQTPESARTRVTGLYQDLLGRTPSAADVAYWGRVVVARGDLALAVQLAASPEYQARAVTRFP